MLAVTQQSNPTHHTPPSRDESANTGLGHTGKAPAPSAVAIWSTLDDSQWAPYLTEVLAHAGTAAVQVSGPAEVTGHGPLLITADPTGTEQAALADWLSAGGVAIRLAGCDDVASDTVTLDATDDLWTHCPPGHLRAIGGRRLSPGPDERVLASWSDGSAAITLATRGAGAEITCGVDLLQSIVRIQQGFRIEVDGRPAADGTAPIDDGILKCEDGMAMELDVDRGLPEGVDPPGTDFVHQYPPSPTPLFDQPHADWWRSALLQLLWWAAERADTTVPWLGYWPAGVDAIAHMSHDADQNKPEDGRAALDAFAEADVRVTWCQVFPGGYGEDIFREITEAGHENALHYNAMADTELSKWGWQYIKAQYAWAQAVTGREDIVSNKNHYTRWEGWTEFYDWCERLGIQIDESRGPSKQGDVGFPFGTAHLSFPLAEPDADKTFHNVLNLPLHTQDLAWAADEACRDVILDGAQDQHGVAHFLFHGPHLRKPPTRAACLAVADEARRRGMPWWTAERINAWERLRRGVRLAIVEDENGPALEATCANTVADAAVLLPAGGVIESATGSQSREVVRHGRRFTEVSLDLPAGTTRWALSGMTQAVDAGASGRG